MTPRTIIIGAGMAGILAGIKLKERGETDFVIYEKGDSVGGTWRENRYPGLACDVPAHSYTYSFALNPEWSSYFAPGPEIRAYFEDIARRFGIVEHVRFNTPIARCEWRDGKWHVETSTGEHDSAEVLVAATGVLHHPMIPDLPGLANFAGPAFHSARWDDSVALDGKRVGVIGTGSTGVQIVSALSDRASKLVHFQRTRQWIMPVKNPTYSGDERRAFREDPSRILAIRDDPAAQARRARFTAAIIDVDSPELQEIQQIVERNLDESVRDPVLREKLRPDYLAACKRMVYSDTFYEAVQRLSVEVEIGAIEQIESNGVRMKDGTFHELDVLVLATGFQADRFTRPIRILGEGGRDLDDLWKEGPRAYYAVTVPGYPNLCLLNGPTGPVGNFSLIDIAEHQWDYFDQLINLLRSGKATAVSPSMEALQAYEAERSEAAQRTVFASGCKSWYLDKNGNPLVWPWSYARFVRAMSAPDLSDYNLA